MSTLEQTSPEQMLNITTVVEEKKNWHILDTEDITWTNIKLTTIYRKTISPDMTGPTSLHGINLYIMKWFDLMTKIFLSIFTY